MLLIVILLGAVWLSLHSLAAVVRDATRMAKRDDAGDSPTAYSHPPMERRAAYAQHDLVLERLIGDRWAPFATRPPDHHDIAEIRAGLHPGVRIQGDPDGVE